MVVDLLGCGRKTAVSNLDDSRVTIFLCLVLSKNSNVKRVFLGDNSIICDERLSDFAGEFDNESSKLYQIATPNDLKCNYPADNQGKFLASVNYKSLPKNDGKMDAA